MTTHHYDSSAILYESCVKQLALFAQGMQLRDVVLGLSGGIDSSLAACMCVDAFGADHVHGIALPGPYSSDHSLHDAQQLAHNLGCEFDVISINEAYEALRSATANMNIFDSKIARENIQARLRMVVLMSFSNAHNWMLINTGNLTEALVGYSTLYGDNAGAFAPLGSLLKRQVYELAKWKNATCIQAGAQARIPEHVIIKAPSAELSFDQKDEDTLGSYSELDAVLHACISSGFIRLPFIQEKGTERHLVLGGDRSTSNSYQEHIACELDADVREYLIEQGIALEYINEVIRKIRASAFKRRIAPLCPIIPYQL